MVCVGSRLVFLLVPCDCACVRSGLVVCVARDAVVVVVRLSGLVACCLVDSLCVVLDMVVSSLEMFAACGVRV